MFFLFFHIQGLISILSIWSTSDLALHQLRTPCQVWTPENSLVPSSAGEIVEVTNSLVIFFDTKLCNSQICWKMLNVMWWGFNFLKLVGFRSFFGRPLRKFKKLWGLVYTTMALSKTRRTKSGGRHSSDETTPKQKAAAREPQPKNKITPPRFNQTRRQAGALYAHNDRHTYIYIYICEKYAKIDTCT